MVRYEPWMENARLDVQRDECGCGEIKSMNVERLVDKVTLERVLLPYVVTPHFAYLQPKAEEIKQRDIQAECFLDFELNRINIRPEYMNNPQELAKIRKMIDELKSDPNVKVNRLDIIGYASPEGTLVTTNVCPKDVPWLCVIIWLPNMISREINITSFLVVKNWDGLEKSTGIQWK